MYKFKFFIDFDKEEKWLNKMARNGYQLFDASFGYNFRPSKPENSLIRIDYRTFKCEKDFIDYCTLFEDSGWKHICGTKHSGNQYFKKITSDSDEDIFSDLLSKAGKYKRLSNMSFSLGVSFIPLFIVFAQQKYINIMAFTNPKLLYYTPGLWKMSGYDFWSHFLFETPFAIFRAFPWLIYLLVIIFYFSFAFKARILYNKNNPSDY